LIELAFLDSLLIELAFSRWKFRITIMVNHDAGRGKGSGGSSDNHDAAHWGRGGLEGESPAMANNRGTKVGARRMMAPLRWLLGWWKPAGGGWAGATASNSLAEGRRGRWHPGL